MARQEQLITFLEHEARYLRERIHKIETLGWRFGITTPDGGTDDVTRAELEESREKLSELETHLHDLKWRP
jgi:hypothetical protein